MTRLSRLTTKLRDRGVRPLVPFLTAGYPDEDTFLKLMEAFARTGCTLVEIGIPFSDPVADGPVIQASSQRALDHGMTLARTIELAAMVHRENGLAVILMGYLNPILHMGPDEFADACREAGVTGVIVPDLPLEESGGLRALLLEADVDLIDLVAPTTDEGRLEHHTNAAGGFMYLVSTTGVTGSDVNSGDDLTAYVERVRRTIPLPLYVGFGIATPEDAARVAACADGAVVGSALIRIIDRAEGPDQAVSAAEEYLTRMIAAMNPNKGQ